MKRLHADLKWLPRPPQDYSSKVASLSDSKSATLGHEIEDLAHFGLDLVQLVNLAKVITQAISENRSLIPLVPFRLALLSNSLSALAVPALIASSARFGIALDVIQPLYDQVVQQCLDPESEVNRSKPDAVLFALDYHALHLTSLVSRSEAVPAAVEQALSYIQSLRDGITKNSNSLCIFQTFAPPIERLFGSLDPVLPGSMSSMVNKINRDLINFAARSGDVILDVAGLAETVGLADWHNPKQWNTTRAPFSDEFLAVYADYAARLIAAMRGKSRKALILDLDNVVWGGVIGDDGLEGIQTSPGDGCGEAHLAIQRFALDLRNRGILLAVCSKNDDVVARTPFEQHPDMLLKLEHIAVFQANWDDKASNIQAIAKELRFSLDALVFLDDNPVERNLVRKFLPEVAVPELTEDPADFPRLLAAAGYFEAAVITEEDFRRAEHYQYGSKQIDLQRRAANLGEYLASLQMTMQFEPFHSIGRSRVVQLINRSNQYNLTGRRYDSAEIMEMEKDPSVFTLQARLRDIFGDNGVISLIICRSDNNATWTVDTWVMSCRAFGRQVEDAIFAELLRSARLAGIDTIVGLYRPTGRNQLAANHYSRLGFALTDFRELTTERWLLEVNGAETQSTFIETTSHHRSQVS